MDVNYAYKEWPSEMLPLPVARALRKLGHDSYVMRAGAGRIPQEIAAARASISRTTLVKIEKGEPGVAIGNYATVLFVLGMTDRLADLADPRNDAVGSAAGRRARRTQQISLAAETVISRGATMERGNFLCGVGPGRRPASRGAIMGTCAQKQGRRDL